jgi:hypothetical protein
LERDRYPRSLAIAQPSMPRPVFMLAGRGDTKAAVSTLPKWQLPMAHLPVSKSFAVVFPANERQIVLLAQAVNH